MIYRSKKHWHRFRAHFRRNRHHVKHDYKGRDLSIDVKHLQPLQPVQFMCNNADFFDCAEQEVISLLQRRPELHDLDKDIDRLRKKFEHTKLAHDGMVALLAQAPRASLAQVQMDAYPHGYRNKQERLYELIDFNDTFVETVLLLREKEKIRFADAAKIAMDRVCKRVGAPCFTNDQWLAIVRGLTREISVYKAAVNNGLSAYLTSRSQDALGIDMQVQDPETGRYINIDVKTPSSYRRRLEQLVREGRLSERGLLLADKQSYVIEQNGRGKHKTEVIVLCILPDLFGEFAEFKFVDETPMLNKLNQLIREHGLTDGGYGRILYK